MVVPILVLPFTAFLFWSLGGGKGVAAPVTSAQGINASLPSAQLAKNEPGDKLSLYQQADQDSVALKEQLRNDPFWQDSLHNPPEISPFSVTAASPGTYNNEAGERQVRDKLALLQEQLRTESEKPAPAINTAEMAYQKQDEDIAQLENMMQQLSGSGTAAPVDPELTQLNGMLEKVLDIQHPDRVREKLRTTSAKEKDRVFPARQQAVQPWEDLFSAPDTGNKRTAPLSMRATPEHIAFYGLEAPQVETANNGITAVIHETQTLVSGANVKLRTTQDMYLQGKLIPAGTFVAGLTALNGERLQIHVTHVRFQDAVFPVDLAVFSLDGIEGIHIRGAISRDAAKQGADDALQTLQMSSLDPSITAQAASAGIETVKSFLSKKTKLVHVTVKADHPVLLMNANDN